MSDDIKARVERARELDKKATKGPWHKNWGCVHTTNHPRTGESIEIAITHRTPLGSDDTVFIAESRTLLPALAVDCERLQKRVAELESAVRTDDSLEATAQRLIIAAHAYWKKLGSEIGQRAVIWLEDTSGRLAIFTRGEYREQLMRNIGLINGPHFFAETGPEQED